VAPPLNPQGRGSCSERSSKGRGTEAPHPRSRDAVFAPLIHISTHFHSNRSATKHELAARHWRHADLAISRTAPAGVELRPPCKSFRPAWRGQDRKHGSTESIPGQPIRSYKHRHDETESRRLKVQARTRTNPLGKPDPVRRRRASVRRGRPDMYIRSCTVALTARRMMASESYIDLKSRPSGPAQRKSPRPRGTGSGASQPGGGSRTVVPSSKMQWDLRGSRTPRPHGSCSG
jgi:hypothetical protein